MYKGPRTQIIGCYGPNTVISMVFGPENPVVWVLGPLGFSTCGISEGWLWIGLLKCPRGIRGLNSRLRMRRLMQQPGTSKSRLHFRFRDII